MDIREALFPDSLTPGRQLLFGLLFVAITSCFFKITVWFIPWYVGFELFAIWATWRRRYLYDVKVRLVLLFSSAVIVVLIRYHIQQQRI